MSLAKRILGGQSAAGNRFFGRLLEWLDSPARLKRTDRERLLRGAGILADQTVLEIGCGSGFFTLSAANMTGNKGTLYSTDIQPLAVEMTEKKVHQAGLTNVIVKKDDAMNSAFGNAMFDTVLLFGIVPAPFISTKILFSEIHRILKPGGVCAIWTAVPLWNPHRAGKGVGFEKMQRKNGVFRLRKPGNPHKEKRARD